MTISFQQLLSDCLTAMGDRSATTWSRVDIIIPWAKEAILAFPLLCPKLLTITVAGAATHCHDMPDDFREIISVEYPTSQEPPVYLDRMNRWDPEFYKSQEHYDIDRNYTDAKGWILWTSKNMAVGQVITANYLANHKTDLTDSAQSLLTVPDEYEYILIAYVVMKGYRERLGNYMQDPTAHMSIIAQMTEMVQHAEQNYHDLVEAAVKKYTDSRILPHRQVDKFDRTY